MIVAAHIHHAQYNAQRNPIVQMRFVIDPSRIMPTIRHAGHACSIAWRIEEHSRDNSHSRTSL
jgi:hypothetical protein